MRKPSGIRRHRVTFEPEARADLFELYNTIADDSGRDVAAAYIDRIEAACMALASFPKRGTRRDDLRPGLRTIGFERRVIIAYLVVKTEVIIVHIFYGGRDIEHLLRGAPDA